MAFPILFPFLILHLLVRSVGHLVAVGGSAVLKGWLVMGEVAGEWGGGTYVMMFVPGAPIHKNRKDDHFHNNRC